MKPMSRVRGVVGASENLPGHPGRRKERHQLGKVVLIGPYCDRLLLGGKTDSVGSPGTLDGNVPQDSLRQLGEAAELKPN